MAVIGVDRHQRSEVWANTRNGDQPCSRAIQAGDIASCSSLVHEDAIEILNRWDDRSASRTEQSASAPDLAEIRDDVLLALVFADFFREDVAYCHVPKLHCRQIWGIKLL